MQRALWISIVLATLAPLTAAGCGDDDGSGGDVDAGRSPSVDAGQTGLDASLPIDAARDEDAGGDPELDASTSFDDAGELDAGSAELDGGAPGFDAGDPTRWLVPPTSACAPTGDVCAAAPVTGIFASYRKDRWLPEYTESGTSDPSVGGRMHVAATSAVTGRVTRVLVDGVDPATITTPPAAGATPPFEWWHVWPRDVRAGEPVWVAFHSRNPAWDSRADAEIVIETDAGEAVRARFPVARTPAPITYVTTTEDLATTLVHVENRDSVARTISRVIVDGRDVTSAACIASRTLAPGAHVLIEVPRCAPATIGSAWSVVVEYEGAPAAVGVGRVLRPFFPIEGWNNTPECPFPGPGGNAENYTALRTAAFDTIYTHEGVCGRCGCNLQDLVNVQLPGAGWRTILTANTGGSSRRFTDTRAITAWATGDESDGSIYAEDGTPNAASKARRSQELWEIYPEVPTFNGAKTNRHIGTFAGMADVQGMDLYVAACAPHITPFGQHPPLRGAYDYLRNTRENHMPGTTWLYSQGLAPIWNKDALIGGGEIHVQPDPQEITVQALSVVAAGGKGLMWFQTNQEEADHAPRRWDAIAGANRMVRAVRELLREGDPSGAASSDGMALVEAIRARDAIVVPVIGLATSSAPTDVSCGAALLSEASVPHWRLTPQTLTVRVRVPADLGVVEVFEVTADGVVNATVTSAGREIVIGNVRVDDARAARLFVLASREDLRAEVAAAF